MHACGACACRYAYTYLLTSIQSIHGGNYLGEYGEPAAKTSTKGKRTLGGYAERKMYIHNYTHRGEYQREGERKEKHTQR